MTPELKPCPFCGSDVSIEGQGFFQGARTIIAVTCGNPECISGGPLPPEQWNRRTPDLTEALARLKALEEEMYEAVYGTKSSWALPLIKDWAYEIAAIRKAMGGAA